jgi:simple sugar transport system substrate-binding protein
MKQDPSIDFVVTLGAPIALNAIDAIKDANGKAKVGTFDFNPQIPPKITSGDLIWAIDQQPFLQGYEAIDSLWLYKNNGNVLGGGKATLTGPYLVDKNNVDFVGKFAAGGTR